MTHQQHNAQRALVAASERATHHPDVYARRATLLCPNCGSAPADSHGFACDYCRGYTLRREPIRTARIRRHGDWT